MGVPQNVIAIDRSNFVQQAAPMISISVVPPVPGPVALVMFDCDGVLVDSERISNEVLAEVIGEYGVTLWWQKSKAMFSGQALESIRDIVTHQFAIEMPADWAHTYYARMIPALAERVTSIAGASDAVEAVLAAGLRCCVASQGPVEKIHASLSRTGLWEVFDGRIYSARDVPRPKPAPDLFLHAAADMGVAPDRCVVIEDSVPGVTAALAAGMRAFAYCPEGGEDEEMLALGATPFRSMHDVATLLGFSL